LIPLELARTAAQRGIYLEITARAGHSLTNGHVVKVAQEAGAKLVLNTDAHAPGDLLDGKRALKIAQGAGLTPESIQNLFEDTEALVAKVVKK
jgi:histidinol phosphatase-like PHP family hydrolase